VKTTPTSMMMQLFIAFDISKYCYLYKILVERKKEKERARGKKKDLNLSYY